MTVWDPGALASVTSVIGRCAVIAGLLVACGGDEQARPAPAAERGEPAPSAPESERGAPPGPPAEVAVTSVAATEVPADLQRREARARAALRRGRAAARRGDREGAIEQLRASIAELPLESAQCELGWALHQSGENEAAEAPLRAAVERFGRRARVGAREQRTYAACLYNLGRVLESREQTAQALAAYRRSLELRPNRVVRERLAALAGADAPAVRAECRPRACESFGGELASVGEQLLARAMREASVDPAHPREGSTRVAMERRRLSDQPELFAAVLEVEVPDGAWRTASYTYLALSIDAGWAACPIGGGVPEGYDETPIVRDVRAHQIVPGGRPEVSVEVAYEAVGYEDGCHNTMGTETTWIIGFDGSRAVIHGSVATGDYWDDCSWGDCNYEECDGPLIECCDPEQVGGGTHYELVDAPPGILRFRRTEGSDADDAERPPIIERRLDELACAAQSP